MIISKGYYEEVGKGIGNIPVFVFHPKEYCRWMIRSGTFVLIAHSENIQELKILRRRK